MGINNSKQMKELPASEIEMTRVLGIASFDVESEFRPACDISHDPDALLKPRKKSGDDSFELSLRYGFTPNFKSPQYEKFLEKKKAVCRERLPPRLFQMGVFYQVRDSKININPYNSDTKGYRIKTTDGMTLLENNMAARNIMKFFQRGRNG